MAAYPLVLVRWHDAWFDIEPPDDGYSATCLAQTVGWLVRQDETVSIAQELLPNDEVRAITHIPEAALVGDIIHLVPRQHES